MKYHLKSAFVSGKCFRYKYLLRFVRPMGKIESIQSIKIFLLPNFTSVYTKLF